MPCTSVNLCDTTHPQHPWGKPRNFCCYRYGIPTFIGGRSTTGNILFSCSYYYIYLLGSVCCERFRGFREDADLMIRGVQSFSQPFPLEKSQLRDFRFPGVHRDNLYVLHTNEMIEGFNANYRQNFAHNERNPVDYPTPLFPFP